MSVQIVHLVTLWMLCTIIEVSMLSPLLVLKLFISVHSSISNQVVLFAAIMLVLIGFVFETFWNESLVHYVFPSPFLFFLLE